jgi:hypothetical protein
LPLEPSDCAKEKGTNQNKQENDRDEKNEEGESDIPIAIEDVDEQTNHKHTWTSFLHE